MIKIAKDRLNQGLDLLGITEACPNSHNCLWLARSTLFRIPNALPRGCPRENCEIIVFRTALENDSPAFYVEALRLSQFNDIVKTTAALVIKRKEVTRKARKRKLRKLSQRTYNLHIFGQLLVLTTYPLFLEAKEVPFLRFKEIAELRNNYREAAMRQTTEKMKKINAEWFGWVEAVIEDLVFNQAYPRAIIYLVYLFLKGLEKTQLPNFKAMSREDKEGFFLEIARGITQNSKTDWH